MRLRIVVLLLAAAACLPAAFASSQEPPHGKNCEGLAKMLALADGKITSAEVVSPGTFVPPNLKPDEKPSPVFRSTPAFCRVTATPTPSSEIKVEVWMPVSGWNGKFRGQGNGGFAGYIDHRRRSEIPQSLRPY